MEKKLNNFCHYCKSKLEFFIKTFKEDGEIRRCYNFFESCSNSKCPFHFDIEGKYHFLGGSGEFIKIQLLW